MTQPAGLPHDGGSIVTTVEIERRYLLKEMPPLPPNAERWSVEQGYFAKHHATDGDAESHPIGRIRRACREDGTVVCTHTIKSGSGLIRQEVEREIDAAQFEKLWPLTSPCQIRKVRHRISTNGLTWEVDQFSGVDLVMAEVELQTPQARVQLPPWLAPTVDREVTDDPAFTNYAIALRLGGERSPSR
jgi:CYTH domain-containing protein